MNALPRTALCWTAWREQAKLTCVGLLLVAGAVGPIHAQPPLPAPEVQLASIELLEGKSTLMPEPGRIVRVSVGQPQIADVTLLNEHTLYLVGQSAGVTNLVLWLASGDIKTWNLNVERDLDPLRKRLKRLFPKETQLEISSSGEAIVLSGQVQEAIHGEQAVALAQAFLTRIPLAGTLATPVAGAAHGFTQSASLSVPATGAVTAGNLTGMPSVGAGPSPIGSPPVLNETTTRLPGAVATSPALGMPHVINLLTLAKPAQVRVEVKVAEVSRLLLEQLGSAIQYQKNGGQWSFGVLSNLLSQGPASVAFNRALSVTLDGQRSDGLIKVLAEPTLMALSGQEARFLAGGKVFIPTSMPNGMGGTMVTLTEQEYGVSLRFLPKVMDEGRIWMSVSPEVSEVNAQGINISSGPGLSPTILPTFTTRSASTTVELHDGEHFLIGGLMRNNVNSNISAMPFLGEIPLLGALFRSPDFQSDRTELVFVVTPHLVSPSTTALPLPTDGYQAPTFGEQLLKGTLEHTP